jgi:hypothetical protein
MIEILYFVIYVELNLFICWTACRTTTKGLEIER